MNTNTQNKIIKNKLGLLRLAEMLGNVSQACKTMGYSRDSFYRFKKLYRSLEELQADVDSWVAHYNQDRPHSGKFCLGRTPMQTFLETKHLAREKQLDLLFEGNETPSDPVVTDFAYTVR